jgi:uncharacterized protein (TIGR03437 family)
MRSGIAPNLLVLLSLVGAGQAQTGTSGPGGVLQRLTVATIAGADSIQAIATDATGNIYAAGSTSSFNLPVANAAQPQPGGAEVNYSLDGGRTWVKSGNPSLMPQTILADPVNAGTVFVGGSDGLYKTTDWGKTWAKIYSSAISVAIYAKNPAHVYAIDSGGSLVLSRDGGQTWASTSVSGAQVLVSPWAQEVIAVTGSGVPVNSATISVLTISLDGGATWSSANPPFGTVTATAFDPPHPGGIYAAGYVIPSSEVPPTYELALSMDSGTTWTSKAASSPFSSVGQLLADPDQSSVLYAGVLASLFKSSDAAASWIQLTGSGGSPLAAVSRQCASAAGLFTVAGSGQVIASPDFGTTWLSPQLSSIVDLSSGAGCAVFALSTAVSNAFVGKLSPDGKQVLWLTYLGGSSGSDTPSAMVVDRSGNVYVAGNTQSSDFPATLPPAGVVGFQNIFGAKYDPNGRLLYSGVIGGAIAFAADVDATGELAIVGIGGSEKFPVTPGAFDTTSGGSFALKLGASGQLSYATFLGTTSEATAVAFDSSGDALVGGSGIVVGPPPGTVAPPVPGFVIGLDPSGANLTANLLFDGIVTAVQSDTQGNVFVAGETADPAFPLGPAGYISPRRSQTCQALSTAPPGFPPVNRPFNTIGADDVFVVKLGAMDLQPVYTALVSGDCASSPTNLVIDASGAPAVSVESSHDFETRLPVLGASDCAGDYFGGASVFRLSQDGQRLTFSSYVSNCNGPTPIAAAPDGSLYVVNGQGALLDIPAPVLSSPSAPAIEALVNSFNGSAGLTPGMFLSIEGENLGPFLIDEGLNPPHDLPTELGGVQVLFDGEPAPILQVSNSRVICVVPSLRTIKRDMRHVDYAVSGSTTIQVSYQGALSNAVIMPVSSTFPGLSARGFPNLPATDGSSDANVYNEDGIPNDAQHPAASGSVVAIFATGLGEPTPPLPEGAVARSSSTLRHPVFVYLNGTQLGDVTGAERTSASTIPGFVNSIWQLRLPIPENSTSGPTQRFPLQLSDPTRILSFPLGIYVQ